jgi:predicted neutral ceramidase superfamily lipid hydrolase
VFFVIILVKEGYIKRTSLISNVTAVIIDTIRIFLKNLILNKPIKFDLNIDSLFSLAPIRAVLVIMRASTPNRFYEPLLNHGNWGNARKPQKNWFNLPKSWLKVNSLNGREL